MGSDAKPKSIDTVVRKIVEADSRYSIEAYGFIFEVLDYTYRMIGERRHVTGQELLEGMRRFALEQYGPMARTVLEHWGIRRCEDVGEIVFNLVEHGLLNKTERDSKEDFKGGSDFWEAFDGAAGID